MCVCVCVYDSTPKKSRRKRDSNPGPSALEVDAFTTRPRRRSFLLDYLGNHWRVDVLPLQWYATGEHSEEFGQRVSEAVCVLSTFPFKAIWVSLC